MRFITFVLASLLIFGPTGFAAEHPRARDLPMAESIAKRAGLDQVLVLFGESLAVAARHNGVDDADFLAHWEAASRDAFGRGGVEDKLSQQLSEVLDQAAMRTIDEFLASPLGERITALQAAVQGLGQAEQIEIIAKGQALLVTAGAKRRGQIEEVYDLSNADLTFAVVAESLRGVALAFHLAEGGDIAVPWEDIDAMVRDKLAGFEVALRGASLGVVASAFAQLSEQELADYLVFLRAPETQIFQTTSVLVLNTAIHDAMGALSKDLARRRSVIAI